MRRIFKLRKRTVVALSVIAVLAIAGGTAFAFLTSTGAGTGTGNVTASTSPLALTFSQPAFSALGQTATVNISATNSGASPEQFTGLSSFSVAPTSTITCPAGSFVAGTPSVSSTSVPAGGTVQVGTVSVTFTNLAAAQNGCIGTGTVTYSATSN